MAGSVKRTKAVRPISVPRTRDEAEAIAAELGSIMRDAERIALDLADQVAKAKLEAKRQTLALTMKRGALEAALFAYAKANRDELLPGLKSVTLAAGVLGWRTGPGKVSIVEGFDEEALILEFEARGLAQFLREELTLDRNAILADPA